MGDVVELVPKATTCTCGWQAPRIGGYELSIRSNEGTEIASLFAGSTRLRVEYRCPCCGATFECWWKNGKP